MMVFLEESLRQHSDKFRTLGKTAFIHNEPIVIHPMPEFGQEQFEPH